MNRMAHRFFLIGLMVLFVLTLSIGFAQSPVTADDDVLKIGSIYVIPIAEQGWSQAHYQGLQAIEDEFGDRVEIVSVAESVPPPDALSTMETMVTSQEADLIIGTSFGFWEPMVELSTTYPEVAFVNCAPNFDVADNAGTCWGRLYQGQYLHGIAAAHQTESNILGFVAPHPTPNVFQGINAFALGAQSVNPEVEVRVVWTNAWHDPAVEREAAMSLIDAGADVISLDHDSPAVPRAAEERGVYSFGYHWPQKEQAPDSVLTSTYWDWSVTYVEVARDVLNRPWEPKKYLGDMENGLIKVNDLSDLAVPEAEEPFQEAKRRLENGSLKIYKGPIHDQDGNEVVAEGEILSDTELFQMDWFVEGIVGTIP